MAEDAELSFKERSANRAWGYVVSPNAAVLDNIVLFPLVHRRVWHLLRRWDVEEADPSYLDDVSIYTPDVIAEEGENMHGFKGALEDLEAVMTDEFGFARLDEFVPCRVEHDIRLRGRRHRVTVTCDAPDIYEAVAAWAADHETFPTWAAYRAGLAALSKKWHVELFKFAKTPHAAVLPKKTFDSLPPLPGSIRTLLQPME